MIFRIFGTKLCAFPSVVKDQLQWVKNRQQTAQQDQSGNGGPDGTNHTNVTDGNHQDGSCDINHDRPTINDHQETTDGGIRTSGQSSNLRGSAGEEGNQRRGVESGQLDLEEERPVRHPFGETTPLHTAARYSVCVCVCVCVCVICVFSVCLLFLLICVKNVILICIYI